jgi:4-hydroxy-tetrahydrodipicolinate reductase
MSELTKVAVLGARGRMGTTVVAAVEGASDLIVHAALDLGDDLAGLRGADVAVDFTVPEASPGNVAACMAAGVPVVVGTTGWTAQRLAALGSPATPVLIVPNFNIGAVLMMRFAELAAPWFESIEVIELHHPDKHDAPSGTARRTAERIAAARTSNIAHLTDGHLTDAHTNPDATRSDASLEGARGAMVAGIPVHSIRVRGLVAHQEVLLGTVGETLSIRHDALDRAGFMPGVLLALRRVRELTGVTVGLDGLLGL